MNECPPTSSSDKNDITALREELFMAIRAVRSGQMTPQQGETVGRLAQVLVNSAKVQLDYVRNGYADEKVGFLEEAGQAADKPAVPGVTVHRIR